MSDQLFTSAPQRTAARRLAAGAGLFVLGFFLGWITKSVPPLAALDTQDKRAPLRAKSHNYKFINPLLAVGDLPEFHEFKPLEQTVTEYIKTYLHGHPGDAISVYFRDLDSSRWMGVDEETAYAPASMYKVVTMIAYLKAAETKPNILSTIIIYGGGTAPSPLSDDFEQGQKIHPNERYTVGDLLYRMIVYSDNIAAGLLLQSLEPNLLQHVFADLGLTMPQVDNKGDTMSAKSYSLFFRILYNGTYLSHDMSEKALELLSKTEFNDGLVAGLPPNTTAAHKFGHRQLPGGEELHDCGIIYYPDHPYLLCIMTRGSMVQNLKSIIRDISQMTYAAVAREHP